MAKVVTDNQYYTAIANAIRTLTGSSNTYTPAQMAPAILGYIAGDIDLSDIESYFITEVVNAMKYVKELGTTEWVHHIVITDNHFTLNYGHSTAIVKAMQDSGYFSKVINLGDIADNGEQASINMAVANYGQFNGDMLFCIGNHDVQFTDWQNYWFNSFLSNDTDIVVSESDNYNYYWDDTSRHIRYIAFHYNTSAGWTYAIDRIKDAPSGYSVITLCHYKDQLNSQILLPIIGRELNYIGSISGHHHIDGQSSLYEGMYNQTWLNNDGHINDNASYPKTDETVNSQAITIMSINTTTKNVKFYRIGIPTTLGQNWQYTYVKGGSSADWITGGYWGTGTVSNVENGYISAKKYPAYDANGNEIKYYFHSNSGTLTDTYNLALDENGNWIAPLRMSKRFGDVWARKGGMCRSIEFANYTNVRFYVMSFVGEGITTANDIVITTERPNIGRVYNSSLWQAGVTLGSDGSQGANETSATTFAFDIQPSTTYRFYVDDADWEGTSYLCAFVYGDTPAATGGILGFKLKRRLGKTSGTWKEITFTTNADEYYCRICVNNITTLTDYASKCKLEVVTA